MDYMKQLNAFGDYSMGMLLPPTATAIYLRLFLMNNKARWCEWFETTDQRLMIETGINSDHTISNNRNILKQKGFIDFQPGGKGKPTRYKIIQLYQEAVPAKTAGSSAGSTASSSASSSAGSTAGILNKNIQDKNNYNAQVREQVINTFQNSIHPVANMEELETLHALADTYGADGCVQAIHEAVRVKGSQVCLLNVHYIRSILRNWKQSGKFLQSSSGQVVPLEDYEAKKRREAAIAKKRDDEVAAIVRRQILGESS